MAAKVPSKPQQLVKQPSAPQPKVPQPVAVQAKTAHSGEGPKPQASLPASFKRQEDFDLELLGKRVSIKLEDGEWITGTLEARSRYWWKLRLDSGPVYVNKSRILVVEPGDGGG